MVRLPRSGVVMPVMLARPADAAAAALVAATAAMISSIALRTASDAQLPVAISSARALSCRLDRP